MRILLGLSGGVDSTYAALALKEAGHDVEAAVLMMHEYTSIDEAQESADSLGIPLHVIDVRDEFEKIVKSNFVSEYTNARTPNPCVVCNSEVKFFYLLKYATENGFDRIATGHYAGIKKFFDGIGEYYAICRGADAKKDQTYMLWRLDQKILSKLVFPLESFMKSDVREKTRDGGLSAAERPDSQEICFLPEGNHTEYIESVAGKCPEGDFVDNEGKILGRHKGIIHYTVGQRKGLGISLGERAFVTEINPENNTVTLSPKMSGKDTVYLTGVVYSGMEYPKDEMVVQLDVKLRYTAPLVKVTAHLYSDGTAVLHLLEPQKFAPGQSAVLYRDGVVMLGGFIK